MYRNIVEFIRTLYPDKDLIPLHAPIFQGNEKRYLNDCLNSTFVSSIGEYVETLEQMICNYTKAKYSVATMNGTSALHIALKLVGVDRESEVITQALTFVATANAISYLGASPIFIDSSSNNLGMCPFDLEDFLQDNAEILETHSLNKKTGKKIAACVPMHVFGNPVELDKIISVCKKYKIPVVEDAAESLGSFYKGVHTGLKGDVGILSFNGNKIITAGGGGMIITNNKTIATKAKHITTTSKVPHRWEYFHDEVGYNYRLPNINAALACAQLEQLPSFIKNKKQTANEYREFFSFTNVKFLEESKDSTSNNWLNAIMFKNNKEKNEFLEFSNNHGIMSRPIWKLMNELPAFRSSIATDLKNARLYESTIVNIPSGVRPEL
jgi:perosamine synthetase